MINIMGCALRRVCGYLAVFGCTMAAASETTPFSARIGAALPPHAGACVLAIDQGRVIVEYCQGLADAEAKTPCTPQTNFRMASVSKQFTAAAVLLLVDRGRLSLDDNLTKFFPGFPAFGERVTVRHLLTHTSGLPPYEQLIPDGTRLQLDDLGVLQLLMGAEKSRFAPGEKFEYSNSGYTLLGIIVEQVANTPFHEFVAQQIFRPLGMNGSVLYQRGLNTITDRAYGHELRDGAWRRADQSLTSAVRGDGGIYTSLRDYRQWLAAIDERKLLSATSYEAMFAPHVKTDRGDSRYGFGWFIDEYRGEPRIHHNGDTQGFRACVQRFPQRRAAIVIQLNSEVEGDPMTKIGERLADMLIFDRQ